MVLLCTSEWFLVMICEWKEETLLLCSCISHWTSIYLLWVTVLFSVVHKRIALCHRVWGRSVLLSEVRMEVLIEKPAGLSQCLLKGCWETGCTYKPSSKLHSNQIYLLKLFHRRYFVSENQEDLKNLVWTLERWKLCSMLLEFVNRMGNLRVYREFYRMCVGVDKGVMGIKIWCKYCKYR